MLYRKSDGFYLLTLVSRVKLDTYVNLLKRDTAVGVQMSSAIEKWTFRFELPVFFRGVAVRKKMISQMNLMKEEDDITNEFIVD